MEFEYGECVGTAWRGKFVGLVCVVCLLCVCVGLLCVFDTVCCVCLWFVLLYVFVCVVVVVCL